MNTLHEKACDYIKFRMRRFVMELDYQNLGFLLIFNSLLVTTSVSQLSKIILVTLINFCKVETSLKSRENKLDALRAAYTFWIVRYWNSLISSQRKSTIYMEQSGWWSQYSLTRFLAPFDPLTQKMEQLN